MRKLYSYFRSSASYRVRIALNYKDLPYSLEGVHLIKDGGQQHQPEYLKLNPQGLVPTLIDEQHTLTQSLAIMEYLEETYPKPAILPNDKFAKAYVRSLSLMIACEIHPLNNLGVLQYLKKEFDISDEQKQQWYSHWVYKGLKAVEARLKASPYADNFCYGEAPTMADMCLIPQVYNANRFNCCLDELPMIRKINDNCNALPAFATAHPDKQAYVDK